MIPITARMSPEERALYGLPGSELEYASRRIADLEREVARLKAEGPPPGLTRRMREALLVIQELCDAGRPPSIVELMVELEMMSKAGPVRLLQELRARGYVDWLPGQARGLRVLRRIAAPEEAVFVSFFDAPTRQLAEWLA